MPVRDPPSDEVDIAPLLVRAQAGDADAFCELLRPLWPTLYRQARALGNDPGLADDLVAETAAEAWRCVGRFRGEARLTTWLYGILLHRHLKLQRRERRWWRWVAPSSSGADALREAARLPDSRREGPSPAEASAVADEAVVLRQVIQRLPPAQQAVLLLRFFQDASLAEIAHTLDCPEGTVKSRLHHALANLRQLWLNVERPSGDKSKKL
jgi:RNA polymerase sigma-70 factor (ECF subfamily)